jgi:uncharacterized cupin superfamily protein
MIPVVARVNLFDAEFDYDGDDPAGYRSGVVNLGRVAGAQALAAKLFEIPAGESLCPYHYEYEEEWLIVLEGSPVVRVPDGHVQLQRGDVHVFPPGPAGAHKVSNGGTATVYVLMFSSAREPAVAVYPDSDKIGVWTGNPDDQAMLRRADGNRDYYDGET